MTSLPTRIAAIRPALESLLDGERAPDAIILSLPHAPLRGQGSWNLPAFLTDRAWHGGRVAVNWTARDFGPGTKLLGALPMIEQDTTVVLADDDVRYHPEFLAGLAAAMRGSGRRSAFSYYTYRLGGLRIGQGCDGFAMPAADIAQAQSFFDRHVADTDLVFVDDLWISYLLATRGVAVRALPLPSSAALIYSQVHEIDALRHLTDRLDRHRLNRVEALRLRRAAPIPLRHRAALALGGLQEAAARSLAARLRRRANPPTGATF